MQIALDVYGAEKGLDSDSDQRAKARRLVDEARALSVKFGVRCKPATVKLQ